MDIKREHYLQQLINKKDDGMIKVITGIRRCGKSYLLDPLYRNHLLAEGVPANHIIKIELDRAINRKYHNNPEQLEQDILTMIKDSDPYYLILDEIQLVEGFELVVNGLLHEQNLDIYITGSNSKFLSSDIITEFRGRGEQIHVHPLSFSEFYAASNFDKTEAWNEYITYGGMPLNMFKKSDKEKAAYLKICSSRLTFAILQSATESNAWTLWILLSIFLHLLSVHSQTLKEYLKHLKVKAKRSCH